MTPWLAPLFLAAQLAVPAPVPPAAPARVDLTVDIRDRNGERPRELTAEDFTLLEDGEARRILEVAPLSTAETPWRLVVYFDRVLSGSRSMRAAAGALAEQSRALVALGAVEVVVAEPEPRVVLAATRDAAAVDDALSRIWLTGEGRDDVRVLRKRYAEDTAGLEPDGDAATLAEEAVETEERLVRRQQEHMVEWLFRQRGQAPRALFLVSDGFDLDPSPSYRSKQGPVALEKVALGVAQTVAALGWTTVALPVGDPSLPDLRRIRPGGGPKVPLGVTVPLGRRPKPAESGKPAEPALPPLVRPQEPLTWLVEASGGELALRPQDVAGAVSRLGSRLRLAFESTGGAEGRPRNLEVRTGRQDANTFALRWEVSGTPEWIAAARARRVLEGEDEGGELGIDTAIRVETSESGERSALLEIRLDPPPDPAESPRLILADPGLNLSLRALTGADLAGEEPGVYRVTFPVAGDADRVVVLVERATGGAWGGEVVFLQPGQETEDAEAEALRPMATAVRPWSEGAGDGFRIRLVVPSRKLAGPVDVEADVRIPSGGRVERVEFFWNDELAATLYSPPFRHRVMVPADRPAGYLRVEARLADGTTAEDAVAINASDLGDRLDVRLVELYVVVTDRDGKPVRGLPREAFRVRQDGREQQLAHFENAGELPLTLAVTIDSSASMFLKLPKVRDAVSKLLDSGLSVRDRALLVDFDTEPRLIKPVTRDLGEVSAALTALTPDGGSNLFEAIVFSLLQLQGVGGRKALVVYSDGIGEGEDTSYRACLRAARESGMPVYLIVTNAKAARGEEPGSFLAEPYSDKIRRLADATGGKAYFVLPNQDLNGAYQEILQELRSQYTLSFYPNEADRDPWRAVKVEVEGKGLSARTLSGYQARR